MTIDYLLVLFCLFCFLDNHGKMTCLECASLHNLGLYESNKNDTHCRHCSALPLSPNPIRFWLFGQIDCNGFKIEARVSKKTGRTFALISPTVLCSYFKMLELFAN